MFTWRFRKNEVTFLKSLRRALEGRFMVWCLKRTEYLNKFISADFTRHKTVNLFVSFYCHKSLSVAEKKLFEHED